MKKISQHVSRVCSLAILLLAVMDSDSAKGAVSKASTASGDKTNAAPPEAMVQKSVFQDDLKNGKDPFFPKSARRLEKVPTPTEKAVPAVAQLALKGISGPSNRRFALINNQPLAAGETAFVRIAGGQVKVHCVEIRENSVVITIEGDPEPKELRLREGL